jgi:predicted N-formylglutamate amidohydrolase
MHSFTPTFMGLDRQWHAGVLYNRDKRLAHLMLELLRREPGLHVGDNEPYSVSDLSDYGVVEYGERRGLPHVELEIRQDLIADDAGQRAWADRLARLLPRAASLLPA